MEHAPAASAAASAQHPIRLVVTDDLRRNRLTVFFRAILAIPLIFWAFIWGIIAVFAWTVMWIAGIILGRIPNGLHTFMAGFLRFMTHVSAYLLLIADPFPGFGGKAGYPVDLEVDPPERQNRLTILFRGILVIPALLVSSILGRLSQLLAIFSWFVALITGRVPEGLRNFAAFALRYEMQTYAYYALLTRRYPSFNVGINA
jgi:hypothetical protein